MPVERVLPAYEVVRTDRLRLRPWAEDDAGAALAVYGVEDVSRWLSPAMDRVRDRDAMRDLLARRRSTTTCGCRSAGCARAPSTPRLNATRRP